MLGCWGSAATATVLADTYFYTLHIYKNAALKVFVVSGKASAVP